MTPEYASPEQVRGEPITTASDIYSLGVILYELLSGQRPYRLTSRTPADAERVICEEEPPKPSTAVLHGDPPKEGSPSGQASPEKLKRQLAGDLDNIILMALRKEPERRYLSVEQLSEDIRRHQAGFPVLARKDTVRYRTLKFLKRQRLPVAAAVAILVSSNPRRYRKLLIRRGGGTHGNRDRGLIVAVLAKPAGIRPCKS